MAQYRLGNLFALGEGVIKDDVAAFFWLTLAVNRSTGKFKEDAAAERARLQTSLTPEQITSVEKRAGEWRASALN